jgi:hypothetical protein
MSKAKLGSGKRFAAVTDSIEKREGLSSDHAKAVAAAIGREKYGKKKFEELAEKGKRRHEGKK